MGFDSLRPLRFNSLPKIVRYRWPRCSWKPRVRFSDSPFLTPQMGVISWEPRHGKFTGRYPWELYGDVTDNLRYTVYVIISLDSCLRAEIQAPKVLRDIFAQEMSMVGKEVGPMRRPQVASSFCSSFAAFLSARRMLKPARPETSIQGVSMHGSNGFHFCPPFRRGEQGKSLRDAVAQDYVLNMGAQITWESTTQQKGQTNKAPFRFQP